MIRTRLKVIRTRLEVTRTRLEVIRTRLEVIRTRVESNKTRREVTSRWVEPRSGTRVVKGQDRYFTDLLQQAGNV